MKLCARGQQQYRQPTVYTGCHDNAQYCHYTNNIPQLYDPVHGLRK